MILTKDFGMLCVSGKFIQLCTAEQKKNYQMNSCTDFL